MRKRPMIKSESILTMDTFYNYLKIELSGEQGMHVTFAPYIQNGEAFISATLHSQLFVEAESPVIANILIANPLSAKEITDSILSLISYSNVENPDVLVRHLWKCQVNKFAGYAVQEFKKMLPSGYVARWCANN